MPSSLTSDTGSFRRILTRNIALPLVLGLVSAGVFVGLISYLMDAMRWVEHTDQVISRAYALQKLDLDMETGLRGYLLAGDDRFLQPYEQAGASIDVERKRLRELVQDNGQQTDRLDRLQAFQARWNNYAAEQIRLKRSDPDYRIGAGIEQGKRYKDAVRGEFDEFVLAERTLRQERTETANRNTTGIVIAFVLFMVATGALLAYRGRRDLLGLSGTFDATLTEQERQAGVLQAQAWLREGQSLLSERLGREQEIDGVGHAALEFLSQYIGIAVGVVYIAEPPGFVRTSTGAGPTRPAASASTSAMTARCWPKRRRNAGRSRWTRFPPATCG
jgi:CHASE3 domain sensor protein